MRDLLRWLPSVLVSTALRLTYFPQPILGSFGEAKPPRLGWETWVTSQSIEARQASGSCGPATTVHCPGTRLPKPRKIREAKIRVDAHQTRPFAHLRLRRTLPTLTRDTRKRRSPACAHLATVQNLQKTSTAMEPNLCQMQARRICRRADEVTVPPWPTCLFSHY